MQTETDSKTNERKEGGKKENREGGRVKSRKPKRTKTLSVEGESKTRGDSSRQITQTQVNVRLPPMHPGGLRIRGAAPRCDVEASCGEWWLVQGPSQAPKGIAAVPENGIFFHQVRFLHVDVVTVVLATRQKWFNSCLHAPSPIGSAVRYSSSKSDMCRTFFFCSFVGVYNTQMLMYIGFRAMGSTFEDERRASLASKARGANFEAA
ncbi:uncharacterized protein J3D65DRAFT_205811 [Phyllosticta citribraziliensis]|uniref:Uncharacterized protein n=1 Tax=Phyllosticta citribraziliensis TaxID=989973 RepID=A0ABR1M3N8_9PEZI